MQQPILNKFLQNILSLATDGKILLWDMRYTEKHKKQLLQHPIKGFSLLRRREGQELPVGGLFMEVSRQNKNQFIVGSQGGSVLRANLTNIMLDKRSKALLDIQTSLKFPGSMYPFMLNLVPERLPQIKNHVQKYCAENKIQEASMQILFKSRPEQKKIYPNAVNFAYEPLLSPVMSVSYNNYNLFVVNGTEGSSKVYKQGQRMSLESIDGGWEVKWITDTRLGGFFDEQWLAFDWITGEVITRVNAARGTKWYLNGQLAIIACEDNKIKVVRLGTNVLEAVSNEKQLVQAKIHELMGR